MSSHHPFPDVQFERLHGRSLRWIHRKYQEAHGMRVVRRYLDRGRWPKESVMTLLREKYGLWQISDYRYWDDVLRRFGSVAGPFSWLSKKASCPLCGQRVVLTPTTDDVGVADLYGSGLPELRFSSDGTRYSPEFIPIQTNRLALDFFSRWNAAPYGKLFEVSCSHPVCVDFLNWVKKDPEYTLHAKALGVLLGRPTRKPYVPALWLTEWFSAFLDFQSRLVRAEKKRGTRSNPASEVPQVRQVPRLVVCQVHIAGHVGGA